MLDLLDGKIDKRAAEALAEEGAKLLLFADHPDLDRLTRVCQRTVGFEAIVSGEETLPAATIAPVLADYLDNLREALLDQEAYADLVQKDMRGVLREILAELRPVDYDDEAHLPPADGRDAQPAGFRGHPGAERTTADHGRGHFRQAERGAGGAVRRARSVGDDAAGRGERRSRIHCLAARGARPDGPRDRRSDRPNSA